MKYQPDRAEERSTKLEDNLKKLPKYNPKKQSSEIYRKELRYIEKKVGFNLCHIRVQERDIVPTP